MKKEFMLVDTITVVSYIDNLSAEKRNSIPLKIYYKIKQAVDKMRNAKKEFEELRDEKMEGLRRRYFTDENTYECEVPQMDENGKEILDKDGNPVLTTGRKLKDEFIDKYQNELNKLGEKFQEVLLTKNTFEYDRVDVGELIDSLPSDTPIESTDIDILDFIFSNPVNS